MKIDEQSEMLNRLGDKNIAEKGRHMRPRLVHNLESQSEIDPPKKEHVIDFF